MLTILNCTTIHGHALIKESTVGLKKANVVLCFRQGLSRKDNNTSEKSFKI